MVTKSAFDMLKPLKESMNTITMVIKINEDIYLF